MEEANLNLDEETFIEAANKLLNVIPFYQPIDYNSLEFKYCWQE